MQFVIITNPRIENVDLHVSSYFICTGSNVPGQGNESLVVHIPKRLASESSANELDHIFAETGSHDKSSKKKKRKKKKRKKDDTFTGSSTVIDDGSQVKIKLKLHK